MSHKHKRSFETEQECDADILTQQNTVKIYSYLCEECGKWHKTKQSPEGREKGLKPFAK